VKEYDRNREGGGMVQEQRLRKHRAGVCTRERAGGDCGEDEEPKKEERSINGKGEEEPV
jgi:hypothetical protein